MISGTRSLIAWAFLKRQRLSRVHSNIFFYSATNRFRFYCTEPICCKHVGIIIMNGVQNFLSERTNKKVDHSLWPLLYEIPFKKLLPSPSKTTAYKKVPTKTNKGPDKIREDNIHSEEPGEQDCGKNVDYCTTCCNIII